jgi:hypothetical protein
MGFAPLVRSWPLLVEFGSTYNKLGNPWGAIRMDYQEPEIDRWRSGTLDGMATGTADDCSWTSTSSNLLGGSVFSEGNSVRPLPGCSLMDTWKQKSSIHCLSDEEERALVQNSKHEEWSFDFESYFSKIEMDYLYIIQKLYNKFPSYSKTCLKPQYITQIIQN